MNYSLLIAGLVDNLMVSRRNKTMSFKAHRRQLILLQLDRMKTEESRGHKEAYRYGKESNNFKN